MKNTNCPTKEETAAFLALIQTLTTEQIRQVLEYAKQLENAPA